jgi:excisionase family DNA binding protein
MSVLPSPRTLGDVPDLLKVDEVAAMLRVSKMTVYRLVHSGELAGVRVGRSYRIPRDAVSALTLRHPVQPSVD